jgi:hypothetical protein
MSRLQAESELLPRLLDWLHRRGRIRFDTVVVMEMPWFGRRIDVVTLTRSGRLTAYELKLHTNHRVIEQAAYNGISFDSSYIVTGRTPSRRSRDMALRAGLGIIVIERDNIQLLDCAVPKVQSHALRKKLVARIQAKAGASGCSNASLTT